MKTCAASTPTTRRGGASSSHRDAIRRHPHTRYIHTEGPCALGGEGRLCLAVKAGGKASLRFSPHRQRTGCSRELPSPSLVTHRALPRLGKRCAPPQFEREDSTERDEKRGGIETIEHCGDQLIGGAAMYVFSRRLGTPHYCLTNSPIHRVALAPSMRRCSRRRTCQP